MNEDFGKVLKLLARETASGDVGLAISPSPLALVNTDRKGDA